MPANISNAFIISQQHCFLTPHGEAMSIANMTKTKRNITEADRRAAGKLRELWAEYKRKHGGISQENAVGIIGYSQPVFSQYLKCTIPLGYEAVIKFARLFGVPPSEIHSSYDFSGFIPSNASTAALREPEAPPYNKLSPDALEVARAWMILPPHRRQCFKESLFLESAVFTLYPWLTIGRPQTKSYEMFERHAEKSFATRGQGKKSGPA